MRCFWTFQFAGTRLARLQASRPRSIQEIRVEFTAPNAVAHRPAEVGEVKAAEERAGLETGERLERARPAVLVQIDLERSHDGRRDPAGTHLVAGKAGRIDDRDIQAGLDQTSRTTRSGRPAADHEDFT